MVRMFADRVYRRVVRPVAGRFMAYFRKAVGREVESPYLTFEESEASGTLERKVPKKRGFTSVEVMFVLAMAGTIAACVLI